VLPRRSSVAFFAGGKTNKGNYAALNSLTISCSCLFDRKPESGHPDSSRQVGQIFLKLCAYENDNSPIEKFDELLAFARVPSNSVRVRLLCAVAESASGLSRRLRRQQLQHVPG
jgi:hypothetical protein